MACCDDCAATADIEARIVGPRQLAAVNAAQWPRTTKVLADYARACMAEGRPFHVTHYFNSTALGPKSFGFFVIDDIIAAASAVAGAIGSVVGPAASIAAVVNTVKGQATASPHNSVTADDIAAAILPNVQAQLQAQGVTLPGAIAHQATSAAILDAFGPQYHNLVLYGGLGLAALLVFKLVKG